jgi:alkylation response protein AidB-like acyl-CoA dehydrogenase
MSDDEQTAMIRETVARFVDRELIPLEPHYLQSKLPGAGHTGLTDAQRQRLRDVSKELGLWGLDAPEDLGGHDLPTRTMAAVHEELGRTCVPFVLPPDSPNLRMLQAVGTAAQKAKYLQPYIEGRMSSAIAISEPGAGGDPAGMKTRAVLEGGQWIINGRKIWITNAASADFIIVMARVGSDQRQGGITSFIVEKGTPGFIIEREIPMLGGEPTYEIVFEDCRIPEAAPTAHAAARDGIDLRRHHQAGARHVVRARAAARNVRRETGGPPGDPVVGRRHLHPHARLPADGARCRRQGRQRRGRPPGSLYDQGVRDRDGL